MKFECARTRDGLPIFQFASETAEQARMLEDAIDGQFEVVDARNAKDQSNGRQRITIRGVLKPATRIETAEKKRYEDMERADLMDLGTRKGIDVGLRWNRATIIKRLREYDQKQIDSEEAARVEMKAKAPPAEPERSIEELVGSSKPAARPVKPKVVDVFAGDGRKLTSTSNVTSGARYVPPEDRED